MSCHWFAAVCLAPCLLVGCGQSVNAPQGNVAIVDLDEVANQLGLGEQWSAELSETQSAVKQQLVGFQQKLNEQLEQKHSEIATSVGTANQLPEDQKVRLATYQEELNKKLRQAQTKAQQHLSQQRSQIIKSYRRQAEQICAEVAQQRGFDIVLTKNQSVVLTHTPGADITSEVAERMKKRLATENFRK